MPSTPISMKTADPATIPLHAIDMSQPDLYESDLALPFFARLRREDPSTTAPTVSSNRSGRLHASTTLSR